MIVWTINRLGDGPMNAYKNLGDDLTGDTPHTANALIISMASAIIRNCIANSTIEQIIKERKELKDKIITQLNKVVAGWGVWLETVEITDVKICSGKLFKDLQCRFRKDEEKKALEIRINFEAFKASPYLRKKECLEYYILYMFHIKDAPSSTSLKASIAQLVRAFGC